MNLYNEEGRRLLKSSVKIEDDIIKPGNNISSHSAKKNIKTWRYFIIYCI